MSKKPRNERSEKAKTNSKWTSNEDYKSNYDRIFGPKVSLPDAEEECETCQGTGEVTEPGGVSYGAVPCPDCKQEKPK